MDLRTYLTAHDTKVTRGGVELHRLAAAVELAPYYLYMAAIGHKQISPKKAIRIEKETGGAVSRRDVCPDFPWEDFQSKAAA